MKDDLTFNIKFIELVYERPCLYDYNRSDYSNRKSQDATWLEIAKIVKESVADCKDRWKNLRGCYTRHLKNNNKPSGSSSKHIKPYYLADYLHFLDQYTKPRQPKGTFKREEQNTQINQKTPIEINDDHESSREVNNYLSPCVSNEIEACSRVGENVSRQNQIINKRVSLSEVNPTAMEYFQSREKNAKHNDDQDPDLAFFYSLLPDVKDMNRDQKRRFKMGVLKLAHNILQENIPASFASQIR